MILELKEAEKMVVDLLRERSAVMDRSVVDVGELAEVDRRVDMAAAYLDELRAQYAVEMEQMEQMWSAREKEVARKNIFT